MKQIITLGLLASFFVLLGVSVGQQPLCGNAGEDYFYLKNIYANNRNIYSPSWIFGVNDNLGSKHCTPISTPSCTNGTCSPDFNKYKVNTYDYSCSVANLTMVNNITSALTSFNIGGGNASCSCTLPPTPQGKYLNGYTLTVYGKIVGFLDGTVNYYKGCEVTPSYQSTPLTVGSIFKQIYVLNSSAHLAASLLFVVCFVLVSIL